MRKVKFQALLTLLLMSGCANSPVPLRSAPAGPEAPLAAPSFLASAGFPLAEPFFPANDLARLRIGMSKAEVMALFSSPKATKRTPKDEYWEYSWFELYFREGRLVNWFTL